LERSQVNQGGFL